VIFTALLDEQDPPASTVTDELGDADEEAGADADVAPLDATGVPDEAAVVELPLLLHAASPVTAATAAIPPRARRARGRRDCRALSDVIGLIRDVIGLIWDNSFVSCFRRTAFPEISVEGCCGRGRGPGEEVVRRR
jgi:hypothetical protein